MSYRVFATWIAWAASLAAGSAAIAVTIQPNEGTSKDSFVYEFLPGFNFNSPPFGALLTAGKTGIGHDTESLVQFDLTTVGLTAAQVTSATLQIWATSAAAAGFGVDPSPAGPIQIDLYSVAGASPAWTESTVTWASKPTTGSLVASTTLSGINQWIAFDVTSLVKQWLDGSLANNGLLLRENAVVGSDPNFVVSVFDSSAGQHAPLLTVVPEPSGLLLAGLGLPIVALAIRRRSGARSVCAQEG
jgi:hypothetical protein